MENKADYQLYKCPYSQIEKDCGHELKGPEGYENIFGVWCACGFRGPVFYLDPKDLGLERKEAPASSDQFYKSFKGDGSTFGASSEAERWLGEHGYSYGPSCTDGPQGIVKGNFTVAKWLNLTVDQRMSLDGTLETRRDEPAILRLKVSPK